MWLKSGRFKKHIMWSVRLHYKCLTWKGALCKMPRRISRLSNSDAVGWIKAASHPRCHYLTTSEWDSEVIYFSIIPLEVMADNWKLPQACRRLSNRSSCKGHLKSRLPCFFFVLVDELFKEANIKLNGKVNYEEFTQMVTLPPVDYWSYNQRNAIGRDGKLSLPWASECVFQESGFKIIKDSAGLLSLLNPHQNKLLSGELSSCEWHVTWVFFRVLFFNVKPDVYINAHM